VTNLEAGHIGQPDIQHYEVEPFFLEEFYSLSSGPAALGDTTIGFQRKLDGICNGRLIFDNQDAGSG
jgi:hypothetical protein